MGCRFCKADLSSGLEVRTGACAGCIGRELASAEEANARVLELTQKVTDLETKRAQYRKAVEERERIDRAEQLGEEAHRRGATEDDNPYNADRSWDEGRAIDDEAAAWAHGWLQMEMIRQVGMAQAVMTWVLSTLAVIREVALGGAPGDEVAAKIATVVEKIEPYIPHATEDADQRPLG